MNNFFKSLREISRFKKSEEEFKNIVFYSENNSYSFFFKSIVDELIKRDVKLSFITSDKEDIFNSYFSKNLKVFTVSNFFLLQYFFSNIKCKNFFLTMPDLGNGILNRSPFTKRYIYIFHSLISATVAYKTDAFKNYDVFFCPTKMHLGELKIIFSNNFKDKIFLKIGYPKINELKNYKPKVIDKKNKILIAPTWGSDGIINKKEILLLIESLLQKNYNVVLRPHPMSFTKDNNSIANILDKFQNNKNFKLSDDKSNLDAFYNCEYLITDWSGSAIEFSLAFKKPSIFLDTDQRIRNKEIKKDNKLLDHTFENICRNEIGIILKIENFSKIGEKLKTLDQNSMIFNEKIVNFEKKNLFNTENAIDISVNEIIKLSNNKVA